MKKMICAFTLTCNVISCYHKKEHEKAEDCDDRCRKFEYDEVICNEVKS